MDDDYESKIESIERRIERLRGRIEDYTELKESLEEELESIRSGDALGIVWKFKLWALRRSFITISKEVKRCGIWLDRLEFELVCSKAIEEITESTRPFDDV